MTDREQGAGRDRGTDEGAGSTDRTARNDDALGRERQDHWSDGRSGDWNSARKSALTDRERQERWPVG